MCLSGKVSFSKTIFLSVLFLMSFTGNAQDPLYSININFSDQSNVQGWNNTNTIPYNGLVKSNLLTDQGNSTGVYLHLDSDWGGVHFQGGQTTDNSGVVPDSVLREYYWTGSYGGVQSSSLTIGGLADTLLYTIEIVGSSTFGLASEGQTYYSIDNITKKLTTYFNLNASVMFDNIVVDEIGEVQLIVSPEAGGEIALINSLVIRAYHKDLLAPPVNLSAVYRNASMQIAWRDRSVIEEQFEIFRKVQSGSFESIGFTSQNVSAFSDNDISAGVAYEYKVRAVDGVGNYSAFSNTLKIIANDIYDSLMVNFGSRRSVTQWNNFLSVPEHGARLSNLVSYSGKKTNVEIFLGPDWEGVGDDGVTTGDNSGIIPDNVLLEYYYFGLEDSTQKPKIIISGLVSGDQYNVRFVSSSKFSNVVDNGTTFYRIGNDTAQLYVQDNTENSALISGAIANENGVLVIDLFKESTTPVGYINALIIESFSPLEVYDPITYADDLLLINGYNSLITVDGQGNNQNTHVTLDDGDYHYGSLIDSAGTLYGVIRNDLGSDKIFAYNTLNGEYYLLKSFDTGEQVYQMILRQGYLYGTTRQTNDPQNSYVFKLKADGSEYESLYEMSGATDGNLPMGRLTVFNEFVVGTTFSGGIYNLGSLFKINLATDEFEVFHHFDGQMGGWSAIGLTMGSDGYLYGISQSLTSPYSYLISIDNDFNVVKVDSIAENEGSNISAPLISKGDYMYGISRSGGQFGHGTVFRYNITMGELESMHSFDSDDAGSTCSLLVTEEDILYGVSGTAGGEGGRLFAIDKNGFFKILTTLDWQGPSYNLSIMPFTSAPALRITTTEAPANLLATNNMDGTVMLSWEDLSVNETGFEVSRREYGGVFEVLDTLASNSTSYLDNILQSKVYEYQVRALANVGNSVYTGPRRVMTYPIANSIKVNFGLNHKVLDSTWNNLLAIPKNGVKSSLLNTATEGRTDISIELTSNWGGVQPQGSITGDDSGVVPDKALQEYYWFGSFGAPVTTSITISGLPPNALFDMVFIGSSQFPGVQDNGSTVYTIGDQSISLDVQENVSNQAILSGVFSDENGQIKVILSKGIDSPLGYINAMTIQSVEPLGAVALPPGELEGSYVQGDILLEWKDTNKSEYGFEISRKGSDGTFMVIDTIGANTTSFSDAAIETNQIYRYKIRTLSQFGDSPYSNEVKITTYPVTDVLMVNFGFRHEIELPEWNNMLAPPQNGLELNDLVTSTGKLTHVSIKLLSDWGGVEASGTVTGNDSGVIPDEGLQEYYWFGIFGAPDTASIRISGLVPNSLFNLRFIASSQFSSFSDNGFTIYVVDEDKVSLYVQENTNNAAFIGGVFADSNGNIDIKLMKAKGTPVGYINALIIESVDELEEGAEPLGIEESNVQVYPNPTHGEFVVRDQEKAIKSASLYGIDGVVRMKKLPINQPVDTGFLKKGVYLIRITYLNGNSIMKKVIIH